MSKPAFAALVVAIAVSNAAVAQTTAPDQSGACKTDYVRYCAGIAPGGGRVVACLNKRHDKLSETCRKVLDARTKQ